MSGINVSYNMSKIGNEMGETAFEGKLIDHTTESAKSIVGDVITEIIDNAVDIALTKNGNPYDLAQTCPALREIIDGLSTIHPSDIKTRAEEPLPLDQEMKRLLAEMMAPPFEIVNYETLPRKDGVGDQPTELASQMIDIIDSHDDISCPSQKIVEKKSRVTDLIMNSKKILTNLMDDESKKNQDEWEIQEEEEVNVIELQEHPFKTNKMEGQIEESKCSLDVYDDVSATVLKKQANLVDTASITDVGEGDKVACANNIEEEASAKDVQNSKSLNSKGNKKKKWGFVFKFLGIKKKLRQNNVIPSTISNP